MQAPIEIAFQNSGPSEAIRSEIEKQAKRLEKFSDGITRFASSRRLGDKGAQASTVRVIGKHHLL